MLDGHGDDLHLIKGIIKHNFSSNVYYKGCPEDLLNDISKRVHEIQSYPSPAASELNELASKKFNLNSNQFLFANGATEAFYLIGQLFSNKTAVIVAPTFSEYEDACKNFNINYRLIPRTELKDINTDLVFICNPNNPDGNIFSSEELELLFQQNPKTTFVIDEAYIEFTNKIASILYLTEKYQNLIIVRSLTKTFTIPGLRLGYVVSNAKIISKLLNLKMPWSVNLLAIKAGEYIFNNYETLQFNIDELIEETINFQRLLSSVKGIKINNSNTSYFLVQLLHKSAKELKEHLITEHQILIRDATNFKELEGEYIRLSTQNTIANLTLISALKGWM